MATVDSKYIDVNNHLTYGWGAIDTNDGKAYISNTPDGTSDPDISPVYTTGTDIKSLYYYTYSASDEYLTLRVDNSLGVFEEGEMRGGFDRLVVGGTSYAVEDAVFSFSVFNDTTTLSWRNLSSNPFGTTVGANVLITFERDSTVKAPIIDEKNHITPQDTSSSTTIDITLKNNGYGGTLQYNATTTTTVPTTGWTASDPSVTRGTAYYLWARQNSSNYVRTVEAYTIPYAFPDVDINLFDEPFELASAATSFSVTIVGGSSVDVYEVRDAAGSTSYGSRTGNGSITVSDAPATNDTKAYAVFAKRTSANGGDDTFQRTRALIVATKSSADSVAGPSSILEGASATFSYYEPSTTVTRRYFHATPDDQFELGYGSFSISGTGDKIGTFSVRAARDRTTEGSETATIRVYDNEALDNILASTTCTITDNSLDPGTDTYGLQIFEAAGTDTVLDSSDSMPLLVLSGTINPLNYTDTKNIAISVPEMTDDGTWVVIFPYAGRNYQGAQINEGFFNIVTNVTLDDEIDFMVFKL